jgi:hypothetical protein
MVRLKASDGREAHGRGVSGEGQLPRPAQAPLATAAAPALPRPWLARRLAAPQCNSLQLPLGSGKEALLRPAGPPGSVPRNSPRALGWGGKVREKVRSPNFAGGNPPPSSSSSLRKNQNTVKWWTRGDWAEVAFEGKVLQLRKVVQLLFGGRKEGAGRKMPGKKAEERTRHDLVRQPRPRTWCQGYPPGMGPKGSDAVRGGRVGKGGGNGTGYPEPA